jgi:hypothetical protein
MMAGLTLDLPLPGQPVRPSADFSFALLEKPASIPIALKLGA